MKINELNIIIKECKKIQKQWELQNGKDCIEANTFKILVKYLQLEHKYKIEVERAGKPIYHYFMYHLPVFSNDYFKWLYNPYNPIRFAMETFDSIEEIKQELKK